MAKKKKVKKKTLTKKKVAKKAAAKKKVAKAKKTSTKAKKTTAKKAKKKTLKKTQMVKSTKKSAPKRTQTKTTAKRATFLPLPSEIPKAQVSEGQSVPEFELLGTNETSVKIPSGQAIVLYFYPKDATPGCTIEGHDFTRLHEEFKNQNVEVYGVSRDTLKSHMNFKSKQNYTVDLLSDTDEKACSIFGVIKEKNMYGRQVRGIERSTFYIDQKGQLVKSWRGVQVAGHAEEVLKFIKENKGNS